jgi:hypothetical protein
MIRLRLLAARRQQASAIRRVRGKPEVIGSPVGFSTDKRAAGQKIGDRITLFAAAMEAASDGEEQTQTSPEDGP